MLLVNLVKTGWHAFGRAVPGLGDVFAVVEADGEELAWCRRRSAEIGGVEGGSRTEVRTRGPGPEFLPAFVDSLGVGREPVATGLVHVHGPVVRDEYQPSGQVGDAHELSCTGSSKGARSGDGGQTGRVTRSRSSSTDWYGRPVACSMPISQVRFAQR